MQKVFIVEDDDSIRDMIMYALSMAGFETKGFADSESFFNVMQNESASLVLLDIMLPGEDGISILKRLRAQGSQKPVSVIMLTAKGTELDRIKGLDLGADDYITKPFSVMEVISRVKAVLRRSEGSPDKPNKIRIGYITLNSDKRAVLVGDREISLTYKEFELLYL